MILEYLHSNSNSIFNFISNSYSNSNSNSNLEKRVVDQSSMKVDGLDNNRDPANIKGLAKLSLSESRRFLHRWTCYFSASNRIVEDQPGCTDIYITLSHYIGKSGALKGVYKLFS